MASSTLDPLRYSHSSAHDSRSQLQHVYSHFFAFLVSPHVFFALDALFVFLEHQSVPFLSSQATGGGAGGGDDRLQPAHVCEHFLALPLEHSFENFLAVVVFLAHHEVPFLSSRLSHALSSVSRGTDGGEGGGTDGAHVQPEQSQPYGLSRLSHVYSPGAISVTHWSQVAPKQVVGHASQSQPEQSHEWRLSRLSHVYVSGASTRQYSQVAPKQVEGHEPEAAEACSGGGEADGGGDGDVG